MTGFLKRTYVSFARAASPLADALLLRGSPPDREKSPARHWLASLFAIHNFDRLVALDVPWWTYRAIDEVEEFLRDRPEARVFEWGSGASTVWLAKRAAQVISVEHHAEWYDYLASKSALSNIDVRLVEATERDDTRPTARSQKPTYEMSDFSDYVGAIDEEPGGFDLIVIDGRARPSCLSAAIPHLNPDGMIVFDNSKRGRYRAAIAQAGLKEIRLAGLTPCLPYPDQTSLLVRP